MKVSDEVEACIRHVRNRAYIERRYIDMGEDENPFESDLMLSFYDGYLQAIDDLESMLLRR